MRNCLRHLLLFALLIFQLINAHAGDVPKRVVSLNVCTDQLAMLLAEPGQLKSLSFLASDEKSSLLHEEAKRLPYNRGLAEEVFLLKPDLVLAGTFSTRTTVQMLKRLGFRVEEFVPENSIEEIKANILRMGDLLGSSTKAQSIVAEMDRRLSKLNIVFSKDVTAAFYYSNSYTAGRGSLISDIAAHAGVRNIADDLGIIGMAPISLEHLLRAKPSLIVANENREKSPALAQQNFAHPAFQHVKVNAQTVQIDGRLTACGGPWVVDAVEELNAAGRIAGAKS